MTPVSETVNCYWWFLWLSQLSVNFHGYQLPETVDGYQCTGFVWLSCLSVATAVATMKYLMQPAMRMQITLSNIWTLFHCESWKMKKACHSTLLLVCFLMHFQKDPEDSICWIERQLLRPSGMQNWKMSFLKEVGWFKECKSREKLNHCCPGWSNAIKSIQYQVW